MRTYAIGDIHGHLSELRKAHRRIAEDRRRVRDPDAPVVHLGDLVDRGPDSAEVIESLIRGQQRGEPWVVLKGNHDRLFQLYMSDPPQNDPRLRPGLTWLDDQLGGAITLASYGVDITRLPAQVHKAALAKVPAAHLAFLRAMPIRYQHGGRFFVHAGVLPGKPLDEQTEDDMLWIRGPFLNDTRSHGALIVHGHTPVPKATHYGNRVNLDSGVAFGGRLSAAVFEGDAVFLLTDEGRVPLKP